MALGLTLVPLLIMFGVISMFNGATSNLPTAAKPPIEKCSNDKFSPQQKQACREQSDKTAATAIPLTEPPSSSEQVAYSQLLDYTRQDRIGQILFGDKRDRAWFTVGTDTMAAAISPSAADQLANQLSRQGVVVRFQPALGGGTSSATIILGSLLIFILFGLTVSFFFRKIFQGLPQMMGEEGMRSQNKKSKITASLVRFDQVAGCDEVVEEVSEFVQFLRDPEKFHKLGAKIPSGLILYGPPGTGKTLVAKAMAGEARVPFFAVAGSEFVEKYVGVGASRIRELFQEARRSSVGAVIFIDEIDAVARRRGDESHPERDQALNELLSQMDGFPTTSRVVVVAATNRLDVIDPALLRPGRFARQVRVGLPDCQGREQILQMYAKDKPMSEDISLEELAESTAGCSGADLEDMLNEAAIMAAREGSSNIKPHHLAEGQLRSLAGPVRKTRMDQKELEMVAYHEAGHVLCAELCQEHDKAQRASIKPRGQAGGLALYGQKDRALHSARYLHERLICALGGRAAEWVWYGAVSSGAANDLQQANALAREAVQELGFSQRTGQVIISSGGQAMHIADATRKVVDEEVERMVAEAYSEAVRLLQEHKDGLNRLAQALLEAEELDRLEIIQAIRGAGELPQVASREPQGMTPKTIPVLHKNTEETDGELIDSASYSQIASQTWQSAWVPIKARLRSRFHKPQSEQ